MQEGTERAAGLLESHPLVESVSINGKGVMEAVLVAGTLDYSPLPTLLFESGCKLVLFREEDVNLETAFLELTQGLVQ